MINMNIRYVFYIIMLIVIVEICKFIKVNYDIFNLSLNIKNKKSKYFKISNFVNKPKINIIKFFEKISLPIPMLFQI